MARAGHVIALHGMTKQNAADAIQCGIRDRFRLDCYFKPRRFRSASGFGASRTSVSALSEGLLKQRGPGELK
jgi:hypothetical protein